MGGRSTGSREFKSTYFMLRIAIIGSAFFVLAAPVAVLLAEGALPPTISDSWHTNARAIFVLGLSAAACLLIVIRGDTLTEQTLLNVAGWLAFVTAGSACWPKTVEGEPDVWDADVLLQNKTVLVALIVFGFAAALAGRYLPGPIVGDGWHTAQPWLRILKVAPFVLLVVASAVFCVKSEWVAQHAHGYAANTMFLLLALAAFLKTSKGIKFLKRIHDLPVDEPTRNSTRWLTEQPKEDRPSFDRAYTAVAVGMFSVAVVAAYLLGVVNASRFVVLPVETLLLVLFAFFWVVQTREAWLDNQAGPATGFQNLA